MPDFNKFALVTSLDQKYTNWKDSQDYQDRKGILKLNGQDWEVQLIKKEKYQKSLAKLCLALIFTIGTVFFGLRNKYIWNLWTGKEVKRFIVILNNKTLLEEKNRIAAEKDASEDAKAKLEVENARLALQIEELRKNISQLSGNDNEKNAQILDLQEDKRAAISKLIEDGRKLEKLQKDHKALQEDFKKQWDEREKWFEKQLAKLVASSVEQLSESVSSVEDGSMESSVNIANLLEQSVRLAASQNGIPSISPQPQAQQPAMTWTETIYKCAQYGADVLSPILSAAYNAVVDQGHQWKDERYRYYLERIQFQLDTYFPNMSLKEQAALDDIFNPPIPKSGRDLYHNFHTTMRDLLRRDEGSSFALLSFCLAWFTELVVEENLVKNVFFLAEEGYKILNPGAVLNNDLRGKTLHDKMMLVFSALDKTPARFLSPILHLSTAKLWKATKYFDPLSHTNMPWKYCTQIYQNGNKLKEIVNIRTGVPIGPAAQGDDNVEGVAVVPEYRAFLEGLKQNKKKLVVFLHLDPSSIVRHEDGSLSTGWNKSPLKMKEATWTRAVMAVEKDFTNNVEINVLPFDGKWKHSHEFHHNGGTVGDFKNWLLELVTKKDSPFFFSDSFLKNVNFSQFIEGVLGRVEKEYFSNLDHILLTKEDKKAFYGIFLTYLQEAIQLHQEADFVQNNCVDGIDRTGEIIGSKLAVNLAKKDKLDDEDFHEEFIGCVTGPALAVWKRPILKDRREIFMAVLEHLHKHPHNLPHNEPSNFNGWTLQDFRI